MADADGKDKRGCCTKLGDGFGNFARFLYNNETGQVMGRSGKSWAKIGFFYLIFYGFLAGFFSGMLAVFLTTLNDPEKGGPKLTQYVANQPGLSRLGGLKLSSYNETNDDEIKDYSDKIDSLLSKYNDARPKCQDSSVEGGMEEGKDCSFNTTLLGGCAKAPYGLRDNTPCIFIKMNKVYGWVPKSSDGKGYLRLACNETVTIFPSLGFQISAFPFRGQKDFELPVVAVQLNRTAMTAVDCWLEGKGIQISESYVPYRAYGRIRIKD